MGFELEMALNIVMAAELGSNPETDFNVALEMLLG